MSKDSPEVIRFLTTFHEVRGLIADDPIRLWNASRQDAKLRRLCIELSDAATELADRERDQRRLFASPVDPAFLASWRDYEARFAQQIGQVYIADLLNFDSPPGGPLLSPWDQANYEGRNQAAAIEDVMNFAWQQVSDDGRDFSDDFREDTLAGISAWDRLKNRTGFDLHGVYRRRRLVPFILIPRHVAALHSQRTDTVNLFTLLGQAHDAFVFGVPLASLALMRALLDQILTKHYGATGDTLEARIKDCRNLPRGVSKLALQRLRRDANDVLHPATRSQAVHEVEAGFLSRLYLLRVLIEGVPAATSEPS